MSRQRILLLAYYAPPVQVTGNIRRYHLCLELQKHFEAVHIITSSNTKRMKHDPSLQLPGIPLIFIPTIDLRRFTLNRQQKQSPTLPHSFKKRKFFKLFRRIADSFPFNILLDDGGPLYIYLSYRKGKRLVQRGKISHLFSSFRPQADHIVAHLLKRKFPHLYWIADYRDLPIDPIRKNVFWPKWQASWQRFLLKEADLVTTVSKGLLTHIQLLHHHTYLLPNGIASTPISSQDLPVPAKLTISYTGSLYPTLQSPTPLFEALRQLMRDGFISPNEIQLIYAGKDGAHWDQLVQVHQLASISTNKGFVSYAEAQRLQQQSHFNLLLSWSSSDLTGVLMAKLYDYLAAGRPIIAIINGNRDLEFEKLFQEWKAGKIFYTGQRKVIRGYLESHISIWRETEEIPSTSVKAELKEYRWDALIGRLMKAF